ncbi:MAG: hypothetical protein ABSA83_03110 [Verrucomicrobiota bacterium]|jgi:hypothetical protein
MKLLPLLLLIHLPAAARAQSDFHAYPGSMKSHESGRMEILTVVSGNLQFKVLPPKGWSREVDAASRKIIFTSPSGRSAVTIQLTTDSPGELPGEDILRAKALQAYPGAKILQYSVFATSGGTQTGVYFDLERVPAPKVVQKIRHAFMAQPTGLVEFVLSASGEEFDNNLPLIMGMSRGFRLDPLKPKQP